MNDHERAERAIEILEEFKRWSKAYPTALQDRPERRGAGGVSYALSELIAGLGELCPMAGLTDIVSVFDAYMMRVLRHAKAPFTVIGRPCRVGVTKTFAALFDPDQAALAAYKLKLGMGTRVLEEGAEEVALRMRFRH
jgi:N-acyl-L-homoserine lactone synthetase